MPTININRSELNNLLGKDFTIKELEENLPMLGIGWEGSKNDEINIEVFPNRPDMLSLEGLARAFSSFMGIQVGLRDYKAEDSKYVVKVDSKVAKVRPYFVSGVIKNVNFTDDFIRSIMQLQEKLHITHCRKREKVAIGLHDLDKIQFPITYTTKPPNFKFIPLEQTKEFSLKEILEKTPKGKEYAWILKGMKEYPIIHDSKNHVLSMPPIINSKDTKLEENTRNVFVDITSMDEKAANEVLNIILTTFVDRGGKLYKVKIKYPNRAVTTPDLNPKTMNLQPEYVNKLLGLKLNTKEIVKCLEKMGFGVSNKKALEVLIPCYRTDIMHPIDLVEDVAIAYRYDNFKPQKPEISTIGQENPLEVFSTDLRSLLVGFGLEEVVTFILTNKSNLFKKMLSKDVPVAEIANPKSQEYCIIRNNLLPSLMEVLSNNTHNEYPQNIFEVGDVIELDSKTETGAKTIRKLAITLCHKNANFSKVKGIFESILQNLGLKNYEVSETSISYYIPGRAAQIKINGKLLGHFGEIHPAVLENWGIEMPTSGGEIDINELFDLLHLKC